MYGYMDNSAWKIYDQIVSRGCQNSVNSKLHRRPEVAWVQKYLMDAEDQILELERQRAGNAAQNANVEYDARIAGIKESLCEVFINLAVLRCNDFDHSKSLQFINDKVREKTAALGNAQWMLTPLEMVGMCRSLLELSDYEDVFQGERIRRARIFCEETVELMTMKVLDESAEFRKILFEVEQNENFRGSEALQKDNDMLQNEAGDGKKRKKAKRVGRYVGDEVSEEEDDDEEGSVNDILSEHDDEEEENDEGNEQRKKRKSERAHSRALERARQRAELENVTGEGAFEDEIWIKYRETFRDGIKGADDYGPPTDTLEFKQYKFEFPGSTIKNETGLADDSAMSFAKVLETQKDFNEVQKTKLKAALELNLPKIVFNAVIDDEEFHKATLRISRYGGEFPKILPYFPLLMARAPPRAITYLSLQDDAWRLGTVGSFEKHNDLETRLQTILALKQWIMHPLSADLSNTCFSFLVRNFKAKIHQKLARDGEAEEDANHAAALMYLSNIGTQYLPCIVLLYQCGMSLTSAARVVWPASNELSSLQLEANIMKMLSVTMESLPNPDVSGGQAVEGAHAPNQQGETSGNSPQDMDLDQESSQKDMPPGSDGQQAMQINKTTHQGQPSAGSRGEGSSSKKPSPGSFEITLHIAGRVQPKEWLAKEKLRLAALVLKLKNAKGVENSRGFVRSIEGFVKRVGKKCANLGNNEREQIDRLITLLNEQPRECISDPNICQNSKSVDLDKLTEDRLLEVFFTRYDAAMEVCNALQHNMKRLQAENSVLFWEGAIKKQVNKIVQAKKRASRGEAPPGFEDFYEYKGPKDTEEMISLVPELAEKFDVVWINNLCVSFSDICGVGELTLKRLLKEESDDWTVRTYCRQAFNYMVTNELKNEFYKGWVGGAKVSSSRDVPGNDGVKLAPILMPVMNDAWKKYKKRLLDGMQSLSKACIDYLNQRPSARIRGQQMIEFKSAFFDHVSRYMIEGASYFEHGTDVYKPGGAGERKYNENRFLHERDVKIAGVLWAETGAGYDFTDKLDSAVTFFLKKAEHAIRTLGGPPQGALYQDVMQNFCFKNNLKPVKDILKGYWKIVGLAQIIDIPNTVVSRNDGAFDFDTSDLLNATDMVYRLCDVIMQQERKMKPALLTYARTAHLLAMGDSSNSYLWTQDQWQDVSRPLKNAVNDSEKKGTSWLDKAIRNSRNRHQHMVNIMTGGELRKIQAETLLAELWPCLHEYYLQAAMGPLEDLNSKLKEAKSTAKYVAKVQEMSEEECQAEIAKHDERLQDMAFDFRGVDQLLTMTEKGRENAMEKYKNKLEDLQVAINETAEKITKLFGDEGVPKNDNGILFEMRNLEKERAYTVEVMRKMAEVSAVLKKIEILKMVPGDRDVYRAELLERCDKLKAEMRQPSKLVKDLKSERPYYMETKKLFEDEFQKSLDADTQRKVFHEHCSLTEWMLQYIVFRRPSFLPYLTRHTSNPFFRTERAGAYGAKKETAEGGREQAAGGDTANVGADNGDWEHDSDDNSNEDVFERDEEEEVNHEEEQQLDQGDSELNLRQEDPDVAQKIEDSLHEKINSEKLISIREKLTRFVCALEEYHREFDVYDALNKELVRYSYPDEDFRQGLEQSVKFQNHFLPEHKKDAIYRENIGQGLEVTNLCMYIAEMEYRQGLWESMSGQVQGYFFPGTDIPLLIAAKDLLDRFLSVRPPNKKEYKDLKKQHKTIEDAIHYVENVFYFVDMDQMIDRTMQSLKGSVQYKCRNDGFFQRALLFCKEEVEETQSVMEMQRVVQIRLDMFVKSMFSCLEEYMKASRWEDELQSLEQISLQILYRQSENPDSIFGRPGNDLPGFIMRCISAVQGMDMGINTALGSEGGAQHTGLIDVLVNDEYVQKAYVFHYKPPNNDSEFPENHMEKIVGSYAAYLEAGSDMKRYMFHGTEQVPFLKSLYSLTSPEFRVREMDFAGFQTTDKKLPFAKTHASILGEVLLELKHMCEKVLEMIEEYRKDSGYFMIPPEDGSDSSGSE